MNFSPPIVVMIVLLGAHILLTWYSAVRRGLIAHRRTAEAPTDRQVWPRVSVIIPAWTERDVLEGCVRSLCSVDYPEWEAVIVAGGLDGTYEYARRLTGYLPNFTVIEQGPQGKNAALNVGIASTRAEVNVFLDADTQVSPGWLREIVRPLGDSVHAATGNIMPLRITPITLGQQMESVAAQNSGRAQILRGGAGIALPRHILEQLGGLPEQVHVGVDWDLTSRLASRGLSCTVCSRALVQTELPATVAEYWRNQLRWRRAHLSSLFRLPGYFLSSPRKICANIYIYCLAWAAALGTLAAVLMVWLTNGSLFFQVFAVWAVLVIWVVARRASLSAEAAACLREIRWLKLFWVPPLLLAVDLAAILPASLSLRAQTAHFKGPRPSRSHSGLNP